MAYIVETDYVLSIAITHLNEILDQAAETSGLTSSQVLQKHEQLAQAKISVYLSTKYNVKDEFLKDGSADPATGDPTDPLTRDPIIVSLYVDLCLCSLHKTINPRDIPEKIDNACQAAMQLLDDIRAGKSGVILVPPVTNEMFVTKLDSQPKFISKEFTDLSILKPDTV